MSTTENTSQENTFFAAIHESDVDAVRKMAGEDEELLLAYDYSEFGATPLNLAAQNGDRAMMRTLVDLGADPNRRSDWSPGPWSPAQLALNHGDTGTAEYLVSCGADVDVHVAAGLGRLDRLKEILEDDREQVHARGGDGCTPLHLAGSPDVVDLLLEYGADLEARDVDHWSTPVQWVALHSPDVARHMFARGAEPDIFSAVLSGATDVVEQLIGKSPDVLGQRINRTTFPPGPDPDVHNILTFSVGMNATPLHAAAVGNQPELVRLLLKHGMDVNVIGAYDDCTPLHLTAWNNRADAARELLKGGAAVETESGAMHSNTPLGWAIVAGSADVAAVLLEHGCEIRDYYLRDAEYGIAGKFRDYLLTSRENYERIAEMLRAA